MADAVRDLVIKVSVQAGETNIQSFKDIAEQIQRELQAAGSVHVGGYSGGSAGSISPGGESRYQYTPPGGFPTAYNPPGPTSYQPGGYQYSGVSGGIGMPGYGQSVRDRGAAFGSEFTSALRQQSGGAGLDDSHWQKLEQKFARQAEVRIREQDREAANAEKAYDREAAAAVRSYSRIMAERRKLSEETTRSLQNEIRMQEKADERSSIVASQEKIARQGQIYNSFGDINRGIGSTLSGGAALYSATGGQDTERVMQIMMAGHGVGAVYRGASGIAGGAAGLAGLGAGAAGALGMGAGAVVAGAAADIGYSHLQMNQSNERMNRLYGRQNRIRAYESTRLSNIGSLRANLDYSRATGINPLASGRDTDRTIDEMGELRSQHEDEADAFAGFGNRVQTLGQYEEDVTRSRQRLGYVQGQRGFNDRLKDLGERRGFLKAGQEKLEEEPDRIRRQARKDRELIDAQVNQIQEDPSGWFGNHSQKQKDTIADLAKQRQQVDVKEQQDIVRNSEEVLRNKEKQAQVEQDILQTLSQQNKSIEQYKSEAMEVVKAATDRTKQHRMELGSSSIGDMWYRKELDEKHKRIESQRAKNRASGANEDANVEEYTQEEIAYLSGTNDVARKSAEVQALKQGKALGIGGYFDEDEQKAKEEYDRRVADTAGKTDQVANSAQESGKSVVGTAKEAVKSLEAAESVKEALELVIEVMQKMRENSEEFKARAREW